MREEEPKMRKNNKKTPVKVTVLVLHVTCRTPRPPPGAAGCRVLTWASASLIRSSTSRAWIMACCPGGCRSLLSWRGDGGHWREVGRCVFSSFRAAHCLHALMCDTAVLSSVLHLHEHDLWIFRKTNPLRFIMFLFQIHLKPIRRLRGGINLLSQSFECLVNRVWWAKALRSGEQEHGDDSSVPTSHPRRRTFPFPARPQIVTVWGFCRRRRDKVPLSSFEALTSFI